ncbi:hypothetical protein [Chromobacterium sp. LK11]|uniref:hypothetical protein n=1 Tax=Chromobacterium sp. LK11 TaxID=1628212 RepID=UPI0012E17D82|nr:hypothetical protein [Chromobacterium sp. LK11]
MLFAYTMRRSIDQGIGQDCLLASDQFTNGSQVSRDTGAIQFRQPEGPTIGALEALRNGHQLIAAAPLTHFTKKAYVRAESGKQSLTSAVERNRGSIRDAGLEAGALLRHVSEGALSAGQAYEAIMALDDQKSKQYWSRLLAEASTDPEDRSMLVQILRNPDLTPAQTAARRALKLIDTITYGPQIELE